MKAWGKSQVLFHTVWWWESKNTIQKNMEALLVCQEVCDSRVGTQIWFGRVCVADDLEVKPLPISYSNFDKRDKYC